MQTNKRKTALFLFFAAALFAAFLAATADAKNGFDLNGALIPEEEILRGGPPRDGIPAIDNPQFAKAEEAAFLRGDDLILGVVVKGEARAYPIRILNWHEVVNDEIQGRKIAVTFCPLCGSGVVFDSARAKNGDALAENGQALSFGVSGLLYNSDVLLYDRKSESLWSQLLRKAVSGKMKGKQLKALPAEHTTWEDWKSRYPNSLVLTAETGHDRDYNRNPYAGYGDSPDIYFPLANRSAEFHPKERVLGVFRGGEHKAYPFSELEKTGKEKIPDTVGGKQITVIWSPASQSARLQNETGEATTLFWFAWFAFHPQTKIYRAN